MHRDPYVVLGVDRKASQEEIAKAYKSLASKYHPDRNPSNPQQAASMFKEVTSAYEKIGDSSKRKQYDFYSSSQVPSFNFRSRNGVDDVFDNLFSQFFGSSKQKNSSIKARLKISLEEAFNGCEKSVKVESKEPCSLCKGTGSVEWEKCGDCNGVGFVFFSEGPMRVQSSCSTCDGRGSKPKQACSSCNGRGSKVISQREIAVSIPAGVEDEMQIRVTSEDAEAPDLFVVVSVDKHPSITRHHRDLIGCVDVSYATLVMGGDHHFDLFGSSINFKIPPRTKSGTRMRIKGQGMPLLQNPKVRGDLFIEVRIYIPSVLSLEHEKLLQRLSKIEKID